MKIELSNRISAHVLDFGYPIDGATRKPLIHAGRRILRRSDGFPKACLDLALPGSLAPHVSGLLRAIHPCHGDAGALTIAPVCRIENGGERLIGQQVVALRVRLRPEDDPPSRPGDTVFSSALAFDWDAWSEAAGGLLPSLGKLLPASPVEIGEVQRRDQSVGRRVLNIENQSGRNAGKGLSGAAERIAAAVLDGERIRLDSRICPDDERIDYEFTQHSCSITISSTRPEDSGVWLIVGTMENDNDEGVKFQFVFYDKDCLIIINRKPSCLSTCTHTINRQMSS